MNKQSDKMEEKRLLFDKEGQVQIKSGNKSNSNVCITGNCRITKILRTVCYFFYNPKYGTIFYYKPLNLIKFLMIYLFIYLFLFALFYGSMQLIFVLTKNPSTVIISKSPAIISLNGHFIPSFNHCNKEEISKVSTKLNKLLELYVNIYNAKKGQLCSQNLNNTLNNPSPCYYDLKALDNCFNNNTSILETGNYCVYLRLSKIIGFKPESTALNNKFAPLKCKIEKGEIVSILPDAFNLDVYPYLNLPDGFIDPIVAVVIKMNTVDIRKLRCHVDLKSVKNNDRFDRVESILNVEVFIDKQTCS